MESSHGMMNRNGQSVKEFGEKVKTSRKGGESI